MDMPTREDGIVLQEQEDELRRRPNRVSPRDILKKLPKPQVLRMKIISMGESGVGKSCIIKRYCEERFASRYQMTIGVDFGVKRVNVLSQEVRVNFWDLSGHNEFFEVRNEFYKDTQGAFLAFDVNDKRTFEALEKWVQESAKYGAKEIVVAVCANKTDTRKRVISEKEGRSWAQAHGFMYFETSASTGENVSDMFEKLFEAVLRNIAS